MTNRDRVIVFTVGFALGLVLVSLIFQRRALKASVGEDPWAEHNSAAITAGAEPLPNAALPVMQKGKIIDFGYLPDAANARQKVWHLSFEKSYPYVRVTEEVQTGALAYMAADQILLKLKDDVDVTALKPMLDTLNLRLRMFNRKEGIAVIGVLDTQIDAVPRTIQAVQAYAELFAAVGPDFIQ